MAWADLDTESHGGPFMIVCCDRAENQLAQAIPGCVYRKDSGLWRVPASWSAWVCLHVSWAGVPIAISPRLAEAARWWAGMARDRLTDRRTLDCPPELADLLDKVECQANTDAFQAGLIGPLPADELKLTVPQRGGAAFLCRWGRRIPGLSGAILEDPTGNGKTGQVIRALQMLAADGQEPYPALVIAPGAALYPWRDKIAAWAPELRVQVVAGTEGKRRKALAEEADIYLLSWPNVRLHTRLAAYPSQAFVKCEEHGGSNVKIKAGGCEVHEKELNGMRLATVVADEAHRMKDARSKQTRAVWHLAQQADRFWPVTGTPVGDTIDDLWPILHGLAPLEHPVRSRYLDMFAEQEYAYFSGATVLGISPGTAAAFHDIVQPLMRRVPKEIARPYQPARLEPEFRYPELPAAQRKLYDQLVTETLADLEDCTVVPQNTAVKFGRLRQLASAAIEAYDGEDEHGFTVQRVRLALPSAKADDLLDFLAGLGPDEQVVVSCQSAQLAALIGHKLDLAKIPACAITGGMTAEQQYAANTAFTAGQARVIAITAAGSESIDLQTASIVYFAEPEPSYLAREQRMGRVDRYGQKSGVRQVHALTRGTVDQRLFDLGCEKAERAAQVEQDAALMRWILRGDENDQE